MSKPIQVDRGVRVLRRLLARSRDLRRLDLAGFRAWLEGHVAYWGKDPALAQRMAIRRLLVTHPHLLALLEAREQAAREDQASRQYQRLRAVERKLRGAVQAVEGLAGALLQATPEERPALAGKLEEFRLLRARLEAERTQLEESSPARQTLLRIEAELARLRAEVGLDEEEAQLASILRQQGRQRTRSGGSFEQTALTVTREHILPEVTPPGLRGADVVLVLTGVTLGAARTELDQVLVRPPDRPGQPVDVLAVVEVKGNLNDLAHGFRQRQENLAWLTGDRAGYKTAAYRTGFFRTGHFDRPALHRQGGTTFWLESGSFHRFRRDPATGYVLGRLYFITREQTLWGVSTAAMARIAHRVTTDPHWDPESDAYLGKLLRWCGSLAEPVEAPDVLDLYAAEPRRARQVLIVTR